MLEIKSLHRYLLRYLEVLTCSVADSSVPIGFFVSVRIGWILGESMWQWHPELCLSFEIRLFLEMICVVPFDCLRYIRWTSRYVSLSAPRVLSS